ncbi:MAG TPA: hypothetical protein VFL42_09670, partial [Terriglobales bacterium]|nr:hypothetical protein [Terriglobales bacterium]
VTYECYWEATKPQDYVIKMQSTGNTTYLSRNPAPEATGAQTSEAPQTAQAARNAAFDPDYQVAFLMSAANRDKVLKLAAQANFFNGNFDYTKHAMANTGRKTLTYADTARHFQTVYNYSENRAIQELTGLFQNISTTLESGHKLAFKHKYDKLGLEAELKALEEEAANHNLAEVQVIAPVLQQIADDPTVLNIARQRARKLLGKAK